MQFPFSLAATALAFSAGVVAAGIFYFFINFIRNKKISGTKIALFISAFAVIAAVICSYFVFFIQYKFPFDFITLTDFIYLIIVFILGIFFLLCTKIFAVTIVPLYLLISLVTFLSLWSLYPRKAFFEFTQTSKETNTVTLVCHKMKPLIILPGPRIWYEPLNSEEKKLNPLFSFVNSNVFEQEKKLIVELPKQEFYPVVYKVNLQCTSTNMFVKAEPVL